MSRFAGADTQQRDRYRLHDPEAFPWLFHGIPLREQRPEQDAVQFHATMRALADLRIAPALTSDLLDTVAGVMHLQSLPVSSDAEGHARYADEALRRLRFVAELWRVDGERLHALLTKAVVRDALRPFTAAQALETRDALAKAVYEGAFLWIVRQLNSHIGLHSDGGDEGGAGDRQADRPWVGVLDLFGFENFFPQHPNSLEQLLINFANERLQDFYEECVERGMNEYAVEGLDTAGLPAELPNRAKVARAVQCLERLLALLADQCHQRNGSDRAFVQAAVDAVAPDRARRGRRETEDPADPPIFLGPRHPPTAPGALGEAKAPLDPRHWDAQTVIGIDHFAEVVWYTVLGDGAGRKGWVHKNAESVPEGLKALLKASGNEALRQGFAGAAAGAGGARRATVGAVFRRSLQDLLKWIKQTDPKWVRCIKPAEGKAPLQFDGQKVMGQLLTVLPMLDTVKTRAKGYPKALLHRDFCVRYRSLIRSSGVGFLGAMQHRPPPPGATPHPTGPCHTALHDTTLHDPTQPEAAPRHPLCRSSLAAFLEAFGARHCGGWSGLEHGQVGRTKVFLKMRAYEELERSRARALAGEAGVIQTFARGLCSVLAALRRLRLRRTCQTVVRGLRLKAARQRRLKAALLGLYYRWKASCAAERLVRERGEGAQGIGEEEGRAWALLAAQQAHGLFRLRAGRLLRDADEQAEGIRQAEEVARDLVAKHMGEGPCEAHARVPGPLAGHAPVDGQGPTAVVGVGDGSATPVVDSGPAPAPAPASALTSAPVSAPAPASASGAFPLSATLSHTTSELQALSPSPGGPTPAPTQRTAQMDHHWATQQCRRLVKARWGAGSVREFAPDGLSQRPKRRRIG